MNSEFSVSRIELASHSDGVRDLRPCLIGTAWSRLPSRRVTRVDDAYNRRAVRTPTIRYARSSTGESIAFHVVGHGPAVVLLFPYHVNHLALNWRVPLHRGATQFLARYFTVINLDFSDAGMSERRAADFSLQSFAGDIDAVLGDLGIARAALCAMGAAGLMACYFASHAPQRVSSVALLQAGDSEANRRVLSLRHVDPDVEAHVRGALLGGLDDHVNAAALAAVARAALDPDSLRSWEKLLDEIDLLSLAAAMDTPALCIHAADDELVRPTAAQALVQKIRRATPMIVPGKSGMDIWRNRSAMHKLASFIARNFEVDLDVVGAAKSSRERRSSTRPASLSEREVEVLRRVAVGRTNQQIAEELFISLNTVSYHLRHIFAKTRAANRTEAASFAHRHGLS